MGTWRVKSAEENVTCSLVTTPKVILNLRVQHKLEILMREYPSQEWLGYLVGTTSKKGNLHATDLVIPPHEEASGASAVAEPFHTPDSCVGFIHSHHSMGAFHSSTDQNHVDKNYPCSITVAKTAGIVVYDAVSVTKTPCGKNIQAKCTVLLERIKPDFDTEAWLKEAKENIDKPIPVYKYGGYVPETNALGDVYELHGDYYQNPNLYKGGNGNKNHAYGHKHRKDPPKLFSRGGKRSGEEGVDYFIRPDGTVITTKELTELMSGLNHDLDE